MASTQRVLLYIMSPSYSGSTLLTTLLAPHPQIATVGELKASQLGDIDRYECSCGALIKACEFWQAVTEGVRQRGGTFSLEHWGTHFHPDNLLHRRILKPLVRGPGLERLRSAAIGLVPGCKSTLAAILRQNQMVIDSVCELQRGEVFLDASKDPLRVKYFIESGLWDVRIVSMTRDGRGTANSDRKHRGLSIAAATREWKRKVLEMEALLDTLEPRRYMRIRYEDMCRDPQSMVRDIYRFAGLSDSGDAPSQVAENHILGNNMRLASIDSVKLDEKWKRELSPVDQMQFSRIAGPLNASLGYSE